MNPRDFLFRESFYETCRAIEDPRVRLAAYDLLCEFGVTGENKIESYPISPEQREILSLILSHPFSSIEATKWRHERSVENGRKGGLKGGKLGGRGHKKRDTCAGQTAQEVSTEPKSDE